MAVWPRGIVGAVLIDALAAGAAPAAEPVPGIEDEARASSVSPSEQDPVPESHREATEPEGERPLSDSIDAVVERFIDEKTPCGRADGLPCFPAAVEREKVELTVEEAFREPSEGPPARPTVPTAAEMIQYGANPHPVSASVGGGTDVPCKARQLFKKLTGRARTYYVYRVWDSTGVRGVLREEPLDPDLFAGTPGFNYELVGRFGDECQALKAYRKIGHDERVDPSEPPSEASTEVTPP